MTIDRILQFVSLVMVALALTASGTMLPRIVQQSDDHVLRYTNASVEGAPPIVVIGTAIGALRGLIVDYLWIKANAMKEKGLFYEAMSDADLITRLQPRFAAVWGFHGHNMAYNISVATNTPQERWEWVNAGIRLVRNQGLRYNPNDMALHRELAFWFAHKIEGVADDAHFYYKRELCREWHRLLGPPPVDHQERIAWIKRIADAPETLAAAENRTPGVKNLVDRLKVIFEKDQPQVTFKLDKTFLFDYSIWEAVMLHSEAAKIMGYEQQARQQLKWFNALDEILNEPAMKAPMETLIAHVRKRVLKDEYNMDPDLMHRYTAELGPIDWRHGSAHALYWSRRGAEFGHGRVSQYDIYIVLNNDSQQLTSMQDLARSGRISFDPLSEEMPGRFPEPRWIDVIDRLFEHFYVKHKDVHGGGQDRFAHFLQNFISSAICEWYRAGETAKAERLMERMRSLFAASELMKNTRWSVPLREFVHNETFDQYQAQPHLAPRDVSASLRYGFKVSGLTMRSEVLRDALIFAAQVTNWFKNNSWNDYVTKFGEGRISDIIGELDESADLAYLQMIVDPAVRMADRMQIWRNTDRIENDVIRDEPSLLKRQAPMFRALVYDRARPVLEQQFSRHELSRTMSFDEAFPPPPGLDQAREYLKQRYEQRQREREEIKQRDPFTRMS